MAVVDVKCVTLYNVRKVRPETIDRILAAKDCGLVPAEASEIDAFTPLMLSMVDVAKMKGERLGPRNPKKAAKKK